MKSIRTLLMNGFIGLGLLIGMGLPAFASQYPYPYIPAQSTHKNTQAVGSTSIWSSMGSVLKFSATHPLLTGFAFAGLGGLYLQYCRNTRPNSALF